MIENCYGGKTYFEPELEDVLKATDLGTEHVVDNWPWGRQQRCTMSFFVEENNRGERLVKQSKMNGRFYKPKTEERMLPELGSLKSMARLGM